MPIFITACLAFGCTLNKPQWLQEQAADAGTAPTEITDPTEPPANEPTEQVATTDAGTAPVEPIEPENTSPIVGALSIEGVMRVGQRAIFIADVADEDGIISCQVAINASGAAGMTLAPTATNDEGLMVAGMVQAVITFTTEGVVSYQVVCVDGEHAIGRGVLISQTILPPLPPPPGPDRLAPTVQLLTPLPAASQDVRDPIAVSASYYDAGGVTGCDVVVDGASRPATIAAGTTAGTGTATATVVVSGLGEHTLAVRCADGNTNLGASETRTVTLTRPPGLGTLTALPATVNLGQAIAFSAPIEARTVMRRCDVIADGTATHAAAIGGTAGNEVATATITLGTAGSHSALLRCTDNLGVTHESNAVALTVLADTAAPTVGAPTWTPADAALVAGTAYAFSATYSDAFGVTGCSATFTDGLTVTAPVAAALNAGTATVNATYAGWTGVTFACSDAAGNSGTASAALTAFVPPPPPPPPPPPAPEPTPEPPPVTP